MKSMSASISVGIGTLALSTPSSGASTNIQHNEVIALKNINSGKVLEVDGWSTSEGANIHQWEHYGGHNNQRWTVKLYGRGSSGSIYYFVNKHSGKIMTVSGAATHNGANVEQHDWVDGDHQLWIHDPLADTLVNRNSRKALEVDGWATHNGANVHQWKEYTPSNDNQRWVGVID